MRRPSACSSHGETSLCSTILARTEHQLEPKEFLHSWELSESRNTGREHLSHGKSRKLWKNRVRASGNLRSATSVVTVLLSLGTKEIVGLLWNHCDYSEKKPTSTRNPSDFKGISHNINGISLYFEVKFRNNEKNSDHCRLKTVSDYCLKRI